MERWLGSGVLRAGTALRFRPWAHSEHSRRTAFRDAGHQSADRALLVSRRTDRVPGEAPERQRMEVVVSAAQPFGGIQQEGSGGRGEPEIEALRPVLLFHLSRSAGGAPAQFRKHSLFVRLF